MKKKFTSFFRSVDPGNMMIFIYVFVVFCILLAGSVSNSYASVNSSIQIEDVSQGELLFTDEYGNASLAPHLERKATIHVSGLTARTTISQEFINDTDTIQDALYVFPLPEGSGVDSLQMVIGSRTITGTIKEKSQAQAVYQKAKSEGKKASLLVQKRPNMFTTQVANIGPGEKVLISIEYQQIVSYRDGIFSLRYPMAITPRYSPANHIEQGLEGEVTFDQSGLHLSHIPPLEEQVSPQEITVVLDSGVPLCCVSSLYHEVQTTKKSPSEYTISLQSGEKSNHDFVLEWEAAEHKLQAALFTEQHDGENYGMVMILPKLEKTDSVEIGREIIFVLDRSGSMSGASMSQAKESLLQALSSLQAHEKFNVITFNHQSQLLFPRAESASLKNIATAKNWVKGVEASGGTEMLPALQAAFASQTNPETLNQVMFITDGAVSNEEQLFSYIHKNVGERRLFVVGIGSAPNSYFMTRAAKMGRGSYTYIGKTGEVNEKIATLFSKISTPALTNIVVEGEDLHHYPEKLPDTYVGEPLLIFFKSDTGGQVTLRGKQADKEWKTTFTITDNKDKSGIARLWAREKISSLMDEITLGADEEEVREEVIQTALRYNLVSKYTSLVAVEEKTPESEDPQMASLQASQPPPLFAGASQTATPAQLIQILSGLAILLSILLLFLCRRVGR